MMFTFTLLQVFSLRGSPDSVRTHACIPDIDNQDSVRRLAVFRLDPVYEFVISMNKYTPVCDACYVLRSGSRCPRRGCADSSLLYALKMLFSFSADFCPNVLQPYARVSMRHTVALSVHITSAMAESSSPPRRPHQPSYTLLYGSAVLILRYAPLDALLYCFPS